MVLVQHGRYTHLGVIASPRDYECSVGGEQEYRWIRVIGMSDSIQRNHVEGPGVGGALPFFRAGGNYIQLSACKAISDLADYKTRVWKAFGLPNGPWSYEDPGDRLNKLGLRP